MSGHNRQIRLVYKRVRKLPREVKVILLGCVLLFYLFHNRYSGIHKYMNHTFEYRAAFIEMEPLHSLQFINLSIITCLKYNVNQEQFTSLDMC